MRTLFFIIAVVVSLGAPLWSAEENNADNFPATPPAAAATPAESDSGLTFGQVVGLLAAAGAIGGGGFAVGKARRVTVEPQPFEVTHAVRYATKEDLDGLAERQGKFETEMRALLRDSEKRSHARMDTISSQLGEITGMLKGMQYINPGQAFIERK